MSAFNLATTKETDLGFVPFEGPLSISGVTLAEGHYEFRVRAAGHWWQDVRFVAAFPITIASGETEATLPIIRNLTYAIEGETVYISWSWALEDGVQTPDDFAIWSASIEPVDMSDAPTYVIPASAPGAITTTITGGVGEFLAVCTRHDGINGPIAKIYVEPSHVSIDSPDNESVLYRLN